MDKVKKQLLQACINHGTLKIEVVQMILMDLCNAFEVEKPNDDVGLKEIVNEINENIREFDHILTIFKHPLDGNEYVVFGLLADNRACKFQPQYTDTERHFFEKLLDTLMTNNEDYSLLWPDIYNIVDSLPSNTQHSISESRIDELGTIWMNQGYLIKHNNKIYIGPRTMVEYGDFLKNAYCDFLTECILCNYIVYWGVKCDNCEIKLHRNCIRKYLIKKNDCPSCKVLWNTRLSL